MRKFGQFVVAFLKAEDGPTAVEYAVMLALIIVVCIGSIAILGSNANKRLPPSAPSSVPAVASFLSANGVHEPWL